MQLENDSDVEVVSRPVKPGEETAQSLHARTVYAGGEYHSVLRAVGDTGAVPEPRPPAAQGSRSQAAPNSPAVPLPEAAKPSPPAASSNQTLGSFLSSSGGDSKKASPSGNVDVAGPAEKGVDQEGGEVNQTDDVLASNLAQGGEAKEPGDAEEAAAEAPVVGGEV
ncbi:hypothetical protein QVD17_11885 [Tagetes erecta]|uniref:Uncharacterized protein n=1 Tax=Tagetes erecta TaxID=13708 RepID=A0AAD8KYU7_TARER|nr:hypothetical protein QVD17_11885 [Tagetes erecta]